MRTFLVGVACAAALSVITIGGLNLMDQSTSDVFYTRYTIPPD